jgi:hypothetical protein
VIDMSEMLRVDELMATLVLDEYGYCKQLAEYDVSHDRIREVSPIDVAIDRVVAVNCAMTWDEIVAYGEAHPDEVANVLESISSLTETGNASLAPLIARRFMIEREIRDHLVDAAEWHALAYYKKKTGRDEIPLELWDRLILLSSSANLYTIRRLYAVIDKYIANH